jgi:hypothetical protein
MKNETKPLFKCDINQECDTASQFPKCGNCACLINKCEPKKKIPISAYDQKHLLVKCRNMIRTYCDLTGTSLDGAQLETNIAGISLYLLSSWKLFNVNELQGVIILAASGQFGKTYPLTLSRFADFMNGYAEMKREEVVQNRLENNGLALKAYKPNLIDMGKFVEKFPEYSDIIKTLKL